MKTYKMIIGIYVMLFFVVALGLPTYGLSQEHLSTTHPIANGWGQGCKSGTASYALINAYSLSEPLPSIPGFMQKTG